MRFTINILILLVALAPSSLFGEWADEHAYTTDPRFPTAAEKTWLTTQPGTVGVPSASATWASTQTTHVGVTPALASALTTVPAAAAQSATDATTSGAAISQLQTDSTTQGAALATAKTNIATHAASLTVVETTPAAVSALQGVSSQQSTNIATHFAITAQNQTDAATQSAAIDVVASQVAAERTTASLVFSSAESVIVTNTNANCAITPTAAVGSQALGASTVLTGTVFDVDLWALVRTKGSAPGNLTAGLNFEGAPICTGQFTPGTGWSDKPMHLHYQVTVQAAGAGGYVIGQGEGTVAGVVTIAAAPTGYSTVAVDFSAEVNIVPAFQWQTADVDNSIIVQQCTIRRAR